MNLNNSLSLNSATNLAKAIENHMNNVTPEYSGTLTFEPHAFEQKALEEVSNKLNDCHVEFINRNNEWLVITTYHSLELLEAELITPGFKMLNNIGVVKVHKETLRIGVRLDNESGKKLKELYAAARKCVK